VSKKALSGIGFFSVEDKPRRQRTAQLSQTSQSALSRWIAANFENALIGDPNLDLVALF
jgi:hypothetical protein